MKHFDFMRQVSQNGGQTRKSGSKHYMICSSIEHGTDRILLEVTKNRNGEVVLKRSPECDHSYHHILNALKSRKTK